MPEKDKPFVVTDRRKFTLDGTPRPDADPSPAREPRDISEARVLPATPTPAAAAPKENSEFNTTSSDADANETTSSGEAMPPAPSAAEMAQALDAYRQTADRLDTAVRAANPGMARPPAMSFDQIVQSIYMTAIMQLGGTTQEGQQPKVDLMGARQSIDMLDILAEKTKGNLSPNEVLLMDNALFEVRMGFLEVTQALGRQASNRAPAGPSIVR